MYHMYVLDMVRDEDWLCSIGKSRHVMSCDIMWCDIMWCHVMWLFRVTCIMFPYIFVMLHTIIFRVGPRFPQDRPISTYTIYLQLWWDDQSVTRWDEMRWDHDETRWDDEMMRGWDDEMRWDAIDIASHPSHYHNVLIAFPLINSLYEMERKTRTLNSR